MGGPAPDMKWKWGEHKISYHREHAENGEQTTFFLYIYVCCSSVFSARLLRRQHLSSHLASHPSTNLK